MIKVTATFILHRPERLLYYLPGNNEVDNYIKEGTCPKAFKQYLYAFGTYDEVGVFNLPAKLQQETGMKWVVGMEFRKDDPRVTLPEELPYIVLPACDVLAEDVAYEYQLDAAMLDEIVDCTRDPKHLEEFGSCYVHEGLVMAFGAKDKLRVLHEIKHGEAFVALWTKGEDDYTNKELYYKAYHDNITGYYNWSWMWNRLATYSYEGVTDYGFVHFDIKDFKMLNELYNHQVANSVLCRVTQNIEEHKDWIYFGARGDNDNFALMIRDMPEEETREKLTAFFEEISRLDIDPSYRIYYRCGVVGMRTTMNTGNVVADCAKLAQLMGTGINNTEINFYTNEMHDNVLWGKHLKVYLDTAIQANEFLVYLQPKMDTFSEEIVGAEALVRWNYKHKELLPPYRFIPYFEADGSIMKVDDVVLHRVCARLKEWKEKGYKLYPVSVNLSRKRLEQPQLVRHLAGIVDLYGIEHAMIEFELTESAAYDNQEYLVYVMNELRSRGFRISMDDFGTGYSSFSLLNKMPLDTLKIDKSFVDLLAVEGDSAKIQIILRHIISMAKELGIYCVAEGVEDNVQVQALRELGCAVLQGYYFSKPLSAEVFEEKYLL